MKNFIYSILLLLATVAPCKAQVINSAEPNAVKEPTESIYKGNKKFYPVERYQHDFKSTTPKNVILMIGDGMGVAAISAGISANGGHLNLDNFKHVGFSKTNAANWYITDSAAGGTAIATGEKTNNGYIGLNAAGDTIYSILRAAQDKGLSTGIVNVNAILDATPASFYAHNISRKNWENIASQLVDSKIDVIIGGDSEKFNKREDNRDLYLELENKGYELHRSKESLKYATGDRIAGLLPYGGVGERGNQLSIGTDVALKSLSQQKKGFFLMIEGSLIDGGGHKNDMTYLVEEMLDFDKAIGAVLEFAAKDGETLVIVTADHETGGVSIVGGNNSEGDVSGRFGTTGHSAVMVPIFAYGPGAEYFTGINENTFFYNAIAKVLNLPLK